jgi:uncharacterized membrane protein
MRKDNRTLGQKLADWLTRASGSWTFITGFLLFLVLWMLINTYFILFTIWDPYPFILLNLVLSCLAAIQAPIILMSQNREMEREHAKSERDYYINRKAEREIKIVQKELVEIKEIVSKQSRKEDTDRLDKEIKRIEEEMEKLNEKRKENY